MKHAHAHVILANIINIGKNRQFRSVKLVHDPLSIFVYADVLRFSRLKVIRSWSNE